MQLNILGLYNLKWLYRKHIESKKQMQNDTQKQFYILLMDA